MHGKKAIERDAEESRRNSEKIKEVRDYNSKIEEIASQFLLTISAEAYVNSGVKKLSDYERPISVDVVNLGDYEIRRGMSLGIVEDGLEMAINNAKERMISKAKKLGAEVVVDVRPVISYDASDIGIKAPTVYFIGTALIPKKAEKTS